MPVIGPGLSLVGAVNSTLLAYTIHTESPPPCPALTSTAEAFGLSVLYVHVRKFGHGEHTLFKSMKKVTSMLLDGSLSEWVNPKHVMYLDCYDNMVAQPSDHIISTFERLDTDLLIAGEEHCWPDPTKVWAGETGDGGMYADLYHKHPEIHAPTCLATGLQFPNLGGMIGSPEALHRMADWILEHYPDARCTDGEEWPNDQACLHRFVLEGLDRDGRKPRIDCGNVFFPLWNLESQEREPIVRFDDERTSWPSIFHFNGHATQAIKSSVENCLAGTLKAQLRLPIQTEQVKFEPDSPVVERVLRPLCDRLRKNIRAARWQLQQ